MGSLLRKELLFLLIPFTYTSKHSTLSLHKIFGQLFFTSATDLITGS